MSWEILVNSKSHLNLAILYTFTGQFEKARHTLIAEWALLYGVIFWFAIYDSYRTSVEHRYLADLAGYQKQQNYTFMIMSTLGINF